MNKSEISRFAYLICLTVNKSFCKIPQTMLIIFLINYVIIIYTYIYKLYIHIHLEIIIFDTIILVWLPYAVCF